MSRKGNCWDNAAMESLFSSDVLVDHGDLVDDEQVGVQQLTVGVEREPRSGDGLSPAAAAAHVVLRTDQERSSYR